MTINKDKLITFLDKLLVWGMLFFCATIPFSIAASQTGIIISMVSWGLLCFLRKKVIWKKNLMLIPIVIFLLTQLLSVLFSIDVARSVHEIRSYWHILIFFFVVSCCSEESLKKGIMILIIATSLAALLGVSQYVYTRFIAPAFMSQQRISGTMGMYMTYSGILMMISIIAFCMFMYDNSGIKKRLLYLGAFIFLLSALVLSLTRSAWLGFLCGMLVIGIVKDRRLLIFLILGTAIAFLLAPKDVKARVKGVLEMKSAVIESGVVVHQGDQRLELWKGGIEVLRHYPLTGVGLLNYRKAYPKYLPYEPKKNFNHAHNNFIHLGAETGYPGLITFIVILIFYLRYIIRKVVSEPLSSRGFDRAISIGMLGAFTAFIVAGLFEYNFGDSEVAMLLWFLMAVPFIFSGHEVPSQSSKSVPS